MLLSQQVGERETEGALSTGKVNINTRPKWKAHFEADISLVQCHNADGRRVARSIYRDSKNEFHDTHGQ